MSHVVVRLGGGRFALPLADVAEVGRLPGLTRVPGTPAWVAGVANWRGRILGVLDLRVLFDVTPGAGGANEGRLVVLSRPGVAVGVLAERVEGVVEVDQLEPVLLTLSADAAELLEGQVTDGGGPVGVIDVGAVLALRQRIGAARRAG